jgi:hypothetical protein
MATKQLSDLNGNLATATLGTLVDGDSATALTAGWYVVKDVLSSGSGLPTGISTKTPFYAAAASITPATNESVYPITFLPCSSYVI